MNYYIFIIFYRKFCIRILKKVLFFSSSGLCTADCDATDGRLADKFTLKLLYFFLFLICSNVYRRFCIGNSRKSFIFFPHLQRTETIYNIRNG